MQYKKIYSLILSLVTVSATPSFAGVVVLAEVPEATKQLLAKAQALVQEHLKAINNQAKEEYLFEQGSYSPHMTLAYVSDKELTMPELEEAEPKLGEHLAELARATDLINMAEGIKESHLVVWPGKNESTYEGNKYKNYAILVIKMKPSAQLLQLVENIDKTLEKYPIALKREFPFSHHVTVGWLYDKKDIMPTPLVEAVKPTLEKLIAEFKSEQPFTIDSFKLSTHDKKKVIYSLKK